MSLVDASLITVAVFFSIYGLACAVECGVAMDLLKGGSQRLRNLFTVFWEVTNVFLVFGFISMMMLFNRALEDLSTALLSTLAVAFFALLLRSGTVLMLFYLKPDKMPRSGIWLFAITSFAVPLSFAASGIYLLTGQLFWSSAIGWALILSAVLGVITIGKLFAEGRSAPDKLVSNELLLVFWLLVVGSALPLAIVGSSELMQTWPLATISFLSIQGLFLVYLVITDRLKTNLVYYAGALALVIPILLALANRPYLIAGKVTLAESFGAASYAGLFLVGAAIILPLVVLGLWLFIRLLKTA